MLWKNLTIYQTCELDHLINIRIGGTNLRKLVPQLSAVPSKSVVDCVAAVVAEFAAETHDETKVWTLMGIDSGVIVAVAEYCCFVGAGSVGRA